VRARHDADPRTLRHHGVEGVVHPSAAHCAYLAVDAHEGKTQVGAARLRGVAPASRALTIPCARASRGLPRRVDGRATPVEGCRLDARPTWAALRGSAMASTQGITPEHVRVAGIALLARLHHAVAARPPVGRTSIGWTGIECACVAPHIDVEGERIARRACVALCDAIHRARTQEDRDDPNRRPAHAASFPRPTTPVDRERSHDSLHRVTTRHTRPRAPRGTKSV
jgi:hypothetical protein